MIKIAEKVLYGLEKISKENYDLKLKNNEINNNIIYFLDNSTLYVRGQLFGGQIIIGETLPDTPEYNTLYINKHTSEIKVWNGVSFNTISKGITISVEDDSSDDLIPTAKAVSQYVQNKIGSLPSSVGIEDISSGEDGSINVQKDGVVTNVPLTGVAYNPTWDQNSNKLTIPISNADALVINFGKDKVSTAGKYNSETKEIWLTTAADKTYDDPNQVIKIPVADLIDEYVGSETNTTITKITNRTITTEVKVSPDSTNLLVKHEDGFYVGSDNSKLNRVQPGKVDEIITANSDGTIKVSGKKIGGNTLVPTPDSNTIATEAAVKAYADAVANSALTQSKTYSDNASSLAETNAKAYAEGLIQWINW